MSASYTLQNRSVSVPFFQIPYIFIIIQYFFLSDTSLHTTDSVLIHITRTDFTRSFYVWVVFHCINVLQSHLSSVDGHLGCFPLLVIVIMLHEYWGTCVFLNYIICGICPVVGLLDHMLVLFQLFKKSPECSPYWLYQWLHHIRSSVVSSEIPFSVHPLQHLYLVVC